MIEGYNEKIELTQPEYIALISYLEKKPWLEANEFMQLILKKAKDGIQVGTKEQD